MKITSIHIKNFRSIKDQKIENIGNTLAFIGKNNAGKSAVLTAIRTLFDNYDICLNDIYKGEDEITIEATFDCSDKYLLAYFDNKTIGYLKNPANSTDFNRAKIGTQYENTIWTQYKEICKGDLADDEKEECKKLWLNHIRKQFSDENNEFHITLKCNNTSLKPEYVPKDAKTILPKIAFIDDTRNFSDEESGKTKSTTANLFSSIFADISNTTENSTCANCIYSDCETRCIDSMQGKEPTQLTIEDLQKLANYQLKTNSANLIDKITQRFEYNYRKDYKINIRPTSNINKSFTLSTKFYDPFLASEVDFSNVGAGLRSVYILSLLQVYQEQESDNMYFIIEEPELYLHPQLQKQMADVISKISKENIVFFSTHSPLLLNAFQENEIRMVSLDENNYQTEINVTSIDEVLEEIGYSTNDIIRTDFTIFVEGPTDKEILELLIAKYYDVDLNKITVMNVNSCENLAFYATLKFLNKTVIKDNLLVLRDSDMKDREHLSTVFKRKLLANTESEFADLILEKTLFTKYSSIEGYLFSPQLLVDKGVFDNIEDVYQEMKTFLIQAKEGIKSRFIKNNNNNQPRIDEFLAKLNEAIEDVANNIEWIKTNVRGHSYFNRISANSITSTEYVESLPKTAFTEILELLNRHSYFSEHKIESN